MRFAVLCAIALLPTDAFPARRGVGLHLGCAARHGSVTARLQLGAQAEPREPLTVNPIGLVSGEVVLPGSKSLSNRALLLAALSEGTTTLSNLNGASDDVAYMISALRQLGVEVDEAPSSAGPRTSFTIKGKAGPFLNSAPGATNLFLGNAGTAMRPLTAALCFGSGSFVLDGVPRMRERPIGDLVSGLKQLGAEVECSDTGCPPVTVHARPVQGGVARVSGKTSSQFISALLMAAPLAKGSVEVRIFDELISGPYVDLTVGLMAQFGVTVECAGTRGGDCGDQQAFKVAKGQAYKSPGHVFVEGDASSASYFLAAGAITGGPVTVVGCGSASVQGDAAFAGVLERMGATVDWAPHAITVSRKAGATLRGVDVDCVGIPDAALTLALVALFAQGPTTIRNVGSWRVKETDRMVAMVTELGKLGVATEEGRDYLKVFPPSADPATGRPALKTGVGIDTYDDHRMAMCFALVACAGVAVTINDPGCVGKTFPDFFERLKAVSSAGGTTQRNKRG